MRKFAAGFGACIALQIAVVIGADVYMTRQRRIAFTAMARGFREVHDIIMRGIDE